MVNKPSTLVVIGVISWYSILLESVSALMDILILIDLLASI